MPSVLFLCLGLSFANSANISRSLYVTNCSRHIMKRNNNPFPQGTDSLADLLFSPFLSCFHLHSTGPPNFTSRTSPYMNIFLHFIYQKHCVSSEILYHFPAFAVQMTFYCLLSCTIGVFLHGFFLLATNCLLVDRKRSRISASKR